MRTIALNIIRFYDVYWKSCVGGEVNWANIRLKGDKKKMSKKL